MFVNVQMVEFIKAHLSYISIGGSKSGNVSEEFASGGRLNECYRWFQYCDTA